MRNFVGGTQFNRLCILTVKLPDSHRTRNQHIIFITKLFTLNSFTLNFLVLNKSLKPSSDVEYPKNNIDITTDSLDQQVAIANSKH